MVEVRSNEDGSWTITKAVLEHKGHKVSEELYRLSSPRRALRALGLLLADGAPTVGGKKTF